MTQPDGAEVRTGVNRGYPGTCANTPGASPDGFVGNRVIASQVVSGRAPHASVAASRNASQSLEPSTHPAMMLASELNVESVSVDDPFGNWSRNFAGTPLEMSTRFRGIRAALARPGDGPPTTPPTANWASEYPAATVVISSMT